MASVTGPSKITISPNPFTENVTVEYSGCKFVAVTDPRIRYKYAYQAKNSNWPGEYEGNWKQYDHLKAKTSGSFDVKLAHIPNGHYVKFKFYALGWDKDNYQVIGTESYKTIQKITPSPCSAPSSFSLNKTLSEGSATLSWSGAADGDANPISGYQIEYSHS